MGRAMKQSLRSYFFCVLSVQVEVERSQGLKGIIQGKALFDSEEMIML